MRHAEQVTVRRLREELAWLGRMIVEEPGSVPPTPPSDSVWRGSLTRKPGSFRERMRRLASMAAAHPDPDVFLRLRLERDVAGEFLAVIESRRQDLSAWGEQLAPEPELTDGEMPWSLHAARTFSMKKARVPEWAGLLALMEDFAETWDDPACFPRRASDAIYIRAGWRCTAPGCSSRRNLEDHHVRYRSRGGGNEPSNRTSACRFHHKQGEHGLFARCTGTAPLNLRWVLGWRGCGGVFRNDRKLE